MTNTIPKRGDVFFCQGSPDAIGSEERKTRPVVIIQNDAGNASSPTVIVANMTTNTSRRLYPMQFDIDLPGHSPSRVQCEQIRTVDKCRLRERIYTLTGEELRKLDICLAVSFGMTRQAAQEAAHSAPEAQDDIFHELTRNGLSVAVCPLPALNQVNITITDGKTVSMTRNVAPAGGIVVGRSPGHTRRPGPSLCGGVRLPSLSREIICPQTGKRDRADHDLAIIENRRGLVPMGPRPEERPLGRTVPDHEVRPSMEGR